MRFDMPLDERMRKAEYKRNRYRMRLAAINKDRKRAGRPLLSSLHESCKLRLPVSG